MSCYQQAQGLHVSAQVLRCKVGLQVTWRMSFRYRADPSRSEGFTKLSPIVV
jgi:hypothetical protein